MIVNLNDIVQFTLTKTGAEVWNARYNDVPEAYRPPARAAGDVVRSQLWVFMEAFGPHIYLGMGEVPTENNTVEFPK